MRVQQLFDLSDRLLGSIKDEVVRELALSRHRASFDALIIQQTYIRTRHEAAPTA